jgi:hypothetical protein
MKRRTQLAKKKQKHKMARANKPKGKSKYAKKKQYLHSNSLWGFEVAEPKPWK